jgi:hypothetical protein
MNERINSIIDMPAIRNEMEELTKLIKANDMALKIKCAEIVTRVSNPTGFAIVSDAKALYEWITENK